MSQPVRAARRRLQAEHDEVVAAIDRCGDAVADPWDSSRTTDRGAVTARLEAALEESGLLSRLPRVLADVVAATGYALQAQPVAGPPYVVVTSRGPILRATIEPGRLVVRFDVFDVVRSGSADEPVAYRRRDGVRLTVSLE
ncbi:hypothetical protein D8Y22_18670 [Salinadaptatus halalkaliphilus]|uniref:DUF7988 domain-containing protein n=1 Tax=Salinadaptatus halalkaliphilus TaxID=2419781 RepID=A0A4V3VKW6_9EURY|nr:hypothetical protein [Salinadaptatus halalkaliphilus]THE63327.1 hypothetical protein D8Y22_18670 [Salinadaptatus halalkaliphilus]